MEAWPVIGPGSYKWLRPARSFAIIPAWSMAILLRISGMEPELRSESSRGQGSGPGSPRDSRAKSVQGGGFGRPDEVLAAIRDELGSEAAEAAQRSAGRARQPRPLTDEESAELQAPLAAVLADLRATGALVPDIQEQAHEDLDPDVVSAWIQSPHGTSGTGIRVYLSQPPAERLANLADQIQEWEVEELSAAGRPATWPECPLHPGTHPLSAQPHAGQAAWCCPKTRQVIRPIGALALSR